MYSNNQNTLAKPVSLVVILFFLSGLLSVSQASFYDRLKQRADNVAEKGDVAEKDDIAAKGDENVKAQPSQSDTEKDNQSQDLKRKAQGITVESKGKLQSVNEGTQKKPQEQMQGQKEQGQDKDRLSKSRSANVD